MTYESEIGTQSAHAGRWPERVIVTGGAGFVGSHVVDALLTAGSRVVVVDDLSTGHAENLPADVDLVRMGIDSNETSHLFETFRPQAVVHLAAQASVPTSVIDPIGDAATNILGSLAIARAAAAAKAEQFIYLNTGGALYGKPRYLPMDEDHPVEPLSPYGLSKWTFERYLPLILPQGMGRKVLRLANVYGPRQDPAGEAGVVAVFAARMIEGLPVEIHGDGKQTRDFVYVTDVARACMAIIGHEASLTVNIASRVGRTVNTLFATLAQLCDYGFPPTYGRERAGDIRHSVLSNGRAADELGWSPEVDFDHGLRNTVAWLRESGVRSAAHSIQPERAERR